MNVTPAEGGPEPLRRALLAHYDRERRDLPWRGETDPYRVLVSEVMLQQTRVETVKGYYEPWLRRFPDLESLAAAQADDVLKAWEGLGVLQRIACGEGEATGMPFLTVAPSASRGGRLRSLPGSRRTSSHPPASRSRWPRGRAGSSAGQRAARSRCH